MKHNINKNNNFTKGNNYETKTDDNDNDCNNLF